MSFSILPEDQSLNLILPGTGSESPILGIIGEGVAANYIPEIGWVGSLTQLEQNKGYWFKTTADIELWKTKKSKHRLNIDLDTEPKIVQIAGSEPYLMGLAANLCAASGVQIIDINM